MNSAIEVQAIYGEDKTSVKQIVTFQETQSVDEAENQECKVYPNPSSGQFNVNLGEGQWNVEVYDLMGRKVYEDLHEGQNVLDLGQCPKGLYFLKAASDGHEVTTKLTIQ